MEKIECNNLDELERGFWYFVNQETYYVKKARSVRGFLREFVGVEVSNYFDIPTVQYQPVEILDCANNKKKPLFGVMAKSYLEQTKQYLPLKSLGVNFSEDMSFLLDIEEQSNYSQLAIDLKKRMIRDFYTQEEDRSLEELMIQSSSLQSYTLVPLHDYENEFLPNEISSHYLPQTGSRDYSCQMEAFTFDPDNPCDQMILHEDDFFQELLYKALNCPFLDLLQNAVVKTEISIPDRFKEEIWMTERQVKKKIKDSGLIKRI